MFDVWCVEGFLHDLSGRAGSADLIKTWHINKVAFVLEALMKCHFSLGASLCLLSSNWWFLLIEK